MFWIKNLKSILIFGRKKSFNLFSYFLKIKLIFSENVKILPQNKYKEIAIRTKSITIFKLFSEEEKNVNNLGEWDSQDFEFFSNFFLTESD